MQILVLGSKGTLGQQLMKVFEGAIGFDRGEADVTNFSELERKIFSLKTQPNVIINCVAYNNVDGAESNVDAAMKLNRDLVKNLANLCRTKKILLIHFSTNYVFDGEKGEYQENDRPLPLSVYGQSKFLGELELEDNLDTFYLVRTAVLFGPKGTSNDSKKSFVDLMLDLGQKEKELKVVSDEINSITYAPDLAEAVKKMIETKPSFGIYHLTNQGQASWYELAKEIFSLKKISVEVEPVPGSSFARQAKRPLKAVLINTKFPRLRPWQEALKEYLSGQLN